MEVNNPTQAFVFADVPHLDRRKAGTLVQLVFLVVSARIKQIPKMSERRIRLWTRKKFICFPKQKTGGIRRDL